jgi:serine/threonine protein phosphatase 1
LKFGGAETLRSYGIEPKRLSALPAEEAIAQLKDAIAPEHVKFMEGFADSISFGTYLFVHAGIRPGVDLSEQSQADLRWIREPFLEDTTDHGHTITNSVEVAPNRIAIDTGAYCTGTLTALAVEDSKRWLIQTSERGTERVPLAD